MASAYNPGGDRHAGGLLTRVCPACGTPRVLWSKECRGCGLNFDELALAELAEAASDGPRPLARLLLLRVRYLLPFLVLGLVVVVPLMFMAASRSPGPAFAPPVGQIWFGSSYSEETFELADRLASVRVGDDIAFAVHLPRPKAAGDRLTATRDGVLVADEALDAFDVSGEVLTGMLNPMTLPGSYSLAIRDVAGGLLANGTLIVNPWAAAIPEPSFGTTRAGRRAPRT